MENITQSTPPEPIQQIINPPTKVNSQGEIEYNKLVNFFKYLVTLVIGAITIVTTVLGFMFYNNLQSMREDVEIEKMRLEEKFVLLQQDWKDQVTFMRIDIKEQKEKVKNELNELVIGTEKEISNTRKDAIHEIENIKSYAVNQAENAASNKINQVFSERNIEDFVINVAEERIKPQINNIVDRKIVELEIQSIDKAINDLSSDNVSKFQQAYTYLEDNRYNLNDGQIKKIITWIQANPSHKYRYRIANILLYHNSDEIKKLYKDFLLNGDIYSRQEPTKYFLIHEVEIDFVISRVLIQINKNNDVHAYLLIIGYGLDVNKNSITPFLNSTILVDRICDILGASNFESFKRSVLNKIGKTLDESVINNTYLFTKSCS